MAQTKSTNVTNADATPQAFNNPHLGPCREYILGKGTVEIAAADANDHEYRICRVHSSWHITSIYRRNDAILSGNDYDVGLYDIAEDGGAVVDANIFADAIDLTSASLTGVEDLFEQGTGVANIDKIEKPIWELLGLSADPGKFYDLVYTGVAVGSGAGTLSVIVRGTRGS